MSDSPEFAPLNYDESQRFDFLTYTGSHHPFPYYGKGRLPSLRPAYLVSYAPNFFLVVVFWFLDEVRQLFKLTSPRIAFCQSESYDIYARAAADLRIEVKLVTFNNGESTMAKFTDIYCKPDAEDDFE